MSLRKVARDQVLGQNCPTPMIYHQSIENCFPAAGGSALQETYANLLETASREVAVLRDRIAFLDLSSQKTDLHAANDLAQQHREDFEDVVVFGAGGSSLGGRVLCALADSNSPRLHFVENIDPHTIATLFRRIDFLKTGFLVISKSGETAETLAQVLVTLDQFRTTLGEDRIREHMTMITGPGDSPLRALAERFRIRTLDHNPDLGGRYSALSLVGLLPAMIAGLDPVAVIEGATTARDAALDAGRPEENAPAIGAAISVALQRRFGVVSTVMMPYVDRLEDFSRWYRQLWAESLGKGGEGTTPISALGTVDQHSQLQLYLDGPADKFITVLLGPMVGEGPRVDPSLASDPRISYLAGHDLGDLMDVSGMTLVETLARHDRPVRTIRIDHIDEVALGALMMHFMLETVATSRLIGVDPFDQPAVEEGKALVRKHMTELKGEG
jgi:glucose-6-phosphate isomerase